MRLSADQVRCRKGFTLIELLVTTAIVLILASLALPAMNSAQSRARRIQCLENQRQMGLAWTLFSDDHSGLLPSNGYVPGGGDPANRRWVQGYLNANVAPDDTVDEDLLIDPRYAQMAAYIRNPAIYQCPSDRSTVVVDGENMPRNRSYSMNAYVGWDGPIQRPLTPGYRVFRSWSDMADFGPAKLMVFLDVNPESICWPFFGVNMGTGVHAQFFAYPADSHDNGANVAFADGHVEYRRWEDRRTIDPGNILHHAHDSASPSNPDLAWLRVRASRYR